jgi:ubiquinone/menaquinone biosynthesis C-methylase UbiE
MTAFFTLHGRPTVKTCYNGIPECAIPGLHDAVFRVLRQKVQRGSKVLDLASGMGAWASRLADAGYEVTACDIDPIKCRVPCERVDLNLAFADRFGPDSFEAVTAIEMLEHIENPRHIFREANRLLKPGGWIVLSTPNASGLHSRVKFLVTGRFAMFDDTQYHGIGHITPLTYWQLEKSLDEAGFTIRNVSFKNNYDLIPRTAGEVVKLAASTFLKPLVRGVAGGQCIVIAAEKTRSI